MSALHYATARQADDRYQVKGLQGFEPRYTKGQLILTNFYFFLLSSFACAKALLALAERVACKLFLQVL